MQLFSSDVSEDCGDGTRVGAFNGPRTSAGLPFVSSSNGQDRQFVMPHFNLSCHGCFQTLNITLLEAVSTDSSFDLQLWRRYNAVEMQPSAVSELYLLNSSVPLTVRANWLPALNVYSFPLNLCFREGDVVGIQLPSNSLLHIASDNVTQIYARAVPYQCTAALMGILAPTTGFVGSPILSLITATKPVITTAWLSQSSPMSTIQYLQTQALSALPSSSVSVNVALSSSQHVIIVGPIVTTTGVLAIFLLILTSALALIYLLRKKTVTVLVESD